MSSGQEQLLAGARDRAQNGNSARGNDGIPQHAFMATVGHLIQNDAGNAHFRVEPVADQHQRRRRARHFHGIQYQQHRSTQQLGQFRRAVRVLASKPLGKALSR